MTGGQGGTNSTGGMGGGGGESTGCVNHERIDLLLAIDNSGGMGDKQQILALTIPEIVNGLTNPPCIDPTEKLPNVQPKTPTDVCPNGYQRMFKPVTDMHLGIITSSIGGHGADTCPDVSGTGCSTGINLTSNDRGHLVSRLDPCMDGNAPTYANKGFLAWDPDALLMPPGETNFDDGMGGGLAPTLKEMVVGTGQIGCGFESQLESIYRFLSEPGPYETIIVENFRATPMGTDSLLLQQRKEFLRPDSLLMVLMLTDEDDCSIIDAGQYYYVAQFSNGGTPVRLPRSRPECNLNPADACCKSCGQHPGNCPAEASCEDPITGQTILLSEVDDSIQLRCWDQKRRFGIDFLYPLDRYVRGFSDPMLVDVTGTSKPNQLFADLDPNDGRTVTRGPEDVLVAGLVGVPWQDIAVDKTNAGKGFKSAAELAAPTIQNAFTTWDVIIGDPANYIPPLDPLMVSATAVRTGINPITNDPIATSTTPLANPINGHDKAPSSIELQYACIFDLPPEAHRDCADPNILNCDCTNPSNDSPLCAANPLTNLPTRQVRAKAHPSTRILELFKRLDDQALVGSICPAQMSNTQAADFGYRPFVRSILQWIARRGC